MKAAVIEDLDKVVVREVADPVQGDRAVVEIETAGLCGTDVKILSGAIPVQFPLVPGHEMVARVVAPGERGLFAAGTRVLIDPGAECGLCRMCRADKGYLCPNGILRGRDVDGGFAELMAVDESRLHPVPESLTPDETALLQVLATCVHAQTLVQVFPGQTAVVVGLGVAGLMHVQLLRQRGITKILGVTGSPWKRELALSMGASAVAAPEDAARALSELSNGQGADLVVEAAGQPATLRASLDLAGPGGTVLIFGIVAGSPELSTYSWYFNELTIVSSRAARARDYDTAVQLAADGALTLAPMVTATYPLDDVADAFDACRTGKQLKVMLRMR